MLSIILKSQRTTNKVVVSKHCSRDSLNITTIFSLVQSTTNIFTLNFTSNNHELKISKTCESVDTN